MDPAVAESWRDRGAAYGWKGDYRQAATDYGEAARLEPADAETRRLRGLAHHLQGDLESAIADYSAAILLDPDLAAAWGCRGLARHQRGRPGPGKGRHRRVEAASGCLLSRIRSLDCLGAGKRCRKQKEPETAHQAAPPRSAAAESRAVPGSSVEIAGFYCGAPFSSTIL